MSFSALMKFEIRLSDGFWEVGFYKRAGGNNWVCLTAYNTQSEAQLECSRLIGGNL